MENLNDLSKIRIADFGLRIILFEVKPGEEERVHGSLIDTFKSEQWGGGETYLYSTLGKYDLMLLYTTDDFRKHDFVALGTIPGIVNAQEMLCFGWELPNSKSNNALSRLVEKLKHKPVLGLSMVKLNPTVVIRDGIELEKKLVLGNQEKDLEILGSLDWNEVVILRSHDKIGETAMAITKFAQEPIYGESFCSSGLKTFSIIGLRVYPQENTAPPLYLEEKIDNKDIGASVHMVCRSGYTHSILKDGKDFFGKSDSSLLLGRRDVRFGVTNITWGTLLQKLTDFRESHKEGVLETSVDVQISVIDLDPPKVPTQKDQICKPIIISSVEAKEILERYDFLGRSFLQLIYRFNNLLQNALLCPVFQRMKPLLETKVNEALKREISEPELNEAIDMFWLAMQQRAIGAYLSLDDSEAIFSRKQGGLQRVFLALDLLPQRFLAPRLNPTMPWEGFCLIGRHDSFAHDVDTINLPVEYATTPEEWWGLSHETIHLLLIMDDTIVGQEFEWLQQFAPSDSEDLLVTDLNLLSETVTEILDFLIFFKADMELYLQKVWGYLIKYIHRVNPGAAERVIHFQRGLFVYAYYKYLLDKDSNPEDLYEWETASLLAQEFMNLLYGIIEGLNAKSKLEYSLDDSQLESCVQYLLDKADFLVALKTKADNLIADINRSASKDTELGKLEENIQILKEGRVITNPILNPWAFVYRLAQEKQPLTIKTQIATILSFWHTAVTEKKYEPCN